MNVPDILVIAILTPVVFIIIGVVFYICFEYIQLGRRFGKWIVNLFKKKKETSP